jgi:RND family efflux transporter MFP subunit
VSRTVRFGSVVITAALGLAACGGKKQSEVQAAAPAPMRLSVATAAETNWPIQVEASGAVAARTEAKVASRVMGYIRGVNVREGDTVKEGQPLIVVEAEELKAQTLSAQAAAQAARDAMAEAEQGINSARANLDLANKTFARMQDLHSKHSLTDQEFDEAAARQRMAEAGLRMAEQRKKQAEAAMEAAAQQARAASIQSGYTSLVAPFAGVVTARNTDPGSLAVPGAPLLTIERAGVYRLEVGVGEDWVARLHLGQPAEVHIDGIGEAFNGRVSEIVPSVDPSSRTFTAKIDLPPTPGRRSGLFGRATFRFGERKTIAAPESAVSSRGQMKWMFVVDHGVARARIVTLGERQSGMVEVLSGVSAGEQVVAPAPNGLVDGTPVEREN